MEHEAEMELMEIAEMNSLCVVNNEIGLLEMTKKKYHPTKHECNSARGVWIILYVCRISLKILYCMGDQTGFFFLDDSSY